MQLSCKRVVVMGLGRFGGGVGVARFLARRGARVLVTDRASRQELADSVARLADVPVEFRLGEHRAEDFAAADLVVVNPAVDPRNDPYLQAAINAGVPLTSEIRMLVAHLPNRLRTIGVTGSAGKSTTTAMIGHILSKCLGPARVHVGGNIGGSLLGDLDTITPDDWVVLELSSFMLEGLALDRWSPHVALVTNLAPNHLDRHGTIEAYAAAKQGILEYQRPEDFAILGDVPHHLIHTRTTHATFLDGLDAWLPRPALRLLLPGEHNAINARMAIEAAARATVPRDCAAAALEDFPGLPHRLQFVCETAPGGAGVRCYNDSKATTPQSATLALRSFPAGKVHVILGGYDKKSDMADLAALAASHCRAVYTIGVTGDVIAALVNRANASLPDMARAQVVPCGTLDRAVAQALARARNGEVVLLSPACASWDQFTHYEQRGAAFIEAVLKYTGEGAAPAPP